MQNSKPSDSLITIQKTKYKRNVLPKSEIIQLYLNPSIASNTKSKVVLPKFSNNDLATHLNNNVETHKNSTLQENSEPKQNSNENKKFHSNEENEVFEKSMEKILSNLAHEFILDCKQRLDSENFSSLLSLLDKYNSAKSMKNDLDSQELKIILYQIHDLINKDLNLCQKFSAFLTDEYAIEFDLVLQANQYEKTLEFIKKLELVIPNRSTFRKLLQSLVSLGNFSSNMDTSISKMEYIKTKIRSATKNNALVNIDLDNLFDQRFVNIEPVYEKISLAQPDLKNFSDQEFIDLTLKSNETSKKSGKNFKNKRSKNSKKN